MRFRLPFRCALFGLAPLSALLAAPPLAAQIQHDHGANGDPAATITAETIHDRLYFIASDALRGRDTPSQGLEAAAAYLVSEHRRMGLEPGSDGSYYQRWPFRLVGPDPESASLSLNGRELLPGVEVALRGGADDVAGDLVFVGGELGQPEEGSLEGRVAVFALPLAGEWSNQANQRSLQQARWADASGAVAAVHVLSPGPGGRIEALAERLAQPSRVMGEGLPFPQVYLEAGPAIDAVPALGSLLERAEADARFTEDLGAALRGSMPPLIHDDAHPANVVAVIPGSDPQLRNEYVVLSAHYDHVGVSTPVDGDSIYNGADDNGSGTVVLLETARAISSMAEAPRRSVAFVHVSGEERGLLGSRWFVENAPSNMPVDRMVANINADMVAGDQHRDTLVVIGKEYSTLGPLVDGINDAMPDLRLVTSDDLWPEQRFFYRSDQLNFMRMEIPSLFFFTGVHECYHEPCDEVDFVDTDKAARVARLLVHSVLAIANADERPEWDPAGLAEVRELTGGL